MVSPAEVLLEQLVVRLGDRLDHLLAVVLGVRAELGRDLFDVVLRAEGLVLEDEGLHLHEVDDALELVFGSDRELQGNGVLAELGADLVDHGLEVRADAVHLVDEGDAGNAVLVGLAPHGLGLRLDAADGAEDADRAVEDAQRALDFDGEVDVARACR